MKIIFESLFITVFIFCIYYFMTVFVNLEVNIFNWEKDTRSLFIFAWFTTALLVIPPYVIIKLEKNE
jgi:hypothetical protein